MKTIKVNGHTLELYTGIDELPITRFNAYNRYLLVDAGIGSDMNDVDRHIGAIRRFLGSKDIASADKELMNMRQNLAFVIGGVSPRMMAFVPLIATMNGRERNDLSDEGVRATLEELGQKGLTVGKLFGLMVEVKKKWNRSWRSFFQSRRTARNSESISPA